MKSSFLLFVTLSGVFSQANDSPRSSLKSAIREFHQALASGKKEKQLEALGKILPTEDDIRVLFPMHSRKLWALLKKAHDSLRTKLPQWSEGFEKAGKVTAIELQSVRDRKNAKAYQEVLEMIPPNTPAYDYVVAKTSTRSGGGTFVFVRQRWILLQGLKNYPKLIKKFEK